MNLLDDDIIKNRTNKKTDMNNTNKRHYLNTEEEKQKAKEETEECSYCNQPFINCGLDCIYHIPKPETRDKDRCRCTCKEKAGVIETREYCSYKKTSIVDDVNDYESIKNYKKTE